MGARLVFGVLGPLEVRLDDAEVRVGGPRQRALLGLLLCHANRVVSRDQLIEELLDDQPAATADRMLRVQISRLRKALGDENGQPRLQSRPPGYLLRVEEGELDLHAFEQQIAAGRQALADGDPARAAGLLREAESLWRGRPLADLEFESFARLEIRQLETLRLQVIEDRIDAELATGQHAVVCPELERLVAEHPLRERLRGQLMVALYRCGRQAEALESYRAGRSLLVEELAVEPGPQLRKLQLAVLEQDAALDLPPAVSPGITAPADAPQDEAPLQPEPAPAPYPRPRRRTRRIALALGTAVALAAVALVPLSRHGKAPASLNANLLALVSPRDGAVQATVPLRAPPADVAAGSGSLWVAEPDVGLVDRVDPARRTVAVSIPVGTRPSRVVAAGGQVWVLDRGDRILARVDPRSDTVAQTIALTGKPGDVLLSAGSLWVAGHGDGTVLRIDPGTGRTTSVISTGGNPSGLAAADGAVWVATDSSGSVARIDTRTGTVTNTIRVGDAPTVVAADASGLWVLDPLDATVARVDPRRDAVTATVALGGQPVALAESGGNIWVADRPDGTLLRLAPGHGTATRFTLGGHPSALAAGGGGLWAAIDAAGASHRGGTLRAVYSTAEITMLDPAAGTSNDTPPLQFLGMTNDGLVTLNHVAGPDGTRLVPDLALALPAPAGDGRTYTFRLRPGIRYSTGAPVRSSDVTRSFERLFKLGGSGTRYYQAIDGATACQKAPATCDLSRGIAADDRAGTVTFHLTQPDPDFLYKLTLAFADVLPATTPDRQAQTSLPATGPYMISRYTPGRELLMVRNPRFREWSAAAQPAGNPDRILARLDLGEDGGSRAVASSQDDFLPSIGQIRSAASYFQHHRSQLRINPQLSTVFLNLNVNVPPFNDLRVRQAVNLALDRRRVVNGWGGPLAAQPTCQILPPGLAGYQRYCPYTEHPGADGSWRAPDLARARRLVAASGTAGMKVTVWNDLDTPQGSVDEAVDLVQTLRQLGYQASLRVLAQSTFFTYINDSRNHAQVVDGGWSADYPTADDFFGKLTCAYYVPGNGVATTDTSELCDPGLDRQIGRAAARQAANPAAAAPLWARLDRQLTDLAIWVPTVVPNELDFLSSRVRNYHYNPIWGALVDQFWIR
jgi:ABC-type transport system substrate-binding protein/DNA-binding SARP family transcriptional activator/DNA-binding beta-propeller fold protein YncE